MALTQISTGGVKNDAVTAGKIPANAVGSSEIADDAVDQGAIADEAVDEARLQISNAGTNGQFLQKQSGNTGGLTWADVPAQYTHPNHSGEVTSTGDGATVIASNIVDEDNLKVDNSPTNDHVLTAKSSAAGGLTWAAVPASGNSIDLVADGAIAAGKPVIIKSNGKAEQVKLTITERTSQNSTPAASSAGSAAVDHTGRSTEYGNLGVVWSETSNVGGYFFREVNTGANLNCMDFAAYGAGNAVKPETGNIEVVSTNGSEITAVWDSSTDNFVVAYRQDSSNKIQVTWTDINPNNTRRLDPHGSADDVEATSSVYPRLCDCGSGRILIVWNENTGNYKVQGRFYVWDSSSSDYVLGPVFDINSSSGGGSSSKREWIDVTYDSTSGKVVAAWKEPNNSDSNKGAAAVGTISGSGSSTTATWGTQVTFGTTAMTKIRIVTDDSVGKVILTYLHSGSGSSKLNYLVGTVSGTSISFGSEGEIDGNPQATRDTYFHDSVYMPSLEKTLFVFSVIIGGNSYPQSKSGAISGTSLTLTNKFNIGPSSSSPNSGGNNFNTLAWMGNNNLSTIFHGWSEGDDSDRGEFRTLHMSTSSSNLTNASQNFLGFAEDAISDGATGTIKLTGNVVGNQSGLTPATWYAVQDNGTLSAGGSSTSSGGLAVASDKLRIKEVTKS